MLSNQYVGVLLQGLEIDLLSVLKGELRNLSCPARPSYDIQLRKDPRIMTEKKCKKCGEIKSLNDFRKKKSVKCGLTARCKACLAEAGHRYYQENKTVILENQKIYYHQNIDRISENQRKYHEANRDAILEYQSRYREANSDYVSQYGREYQKANPGLFKAHGAKRRAMQISVTTTDPWELAQITLFYADCPDGWHVDHIIPLAKGGRHELCNLQHLEDWMNLSKHAKHPDDWDDPRPISCRA